MTAPGLRCLACCLNRHEGCAGDPCGCGECHPWPPQTDSHPFDLPVGDQR